eukprot:6380165-Alexandrium_andersonii.AAC.1
MSCPKPWVTLVALQYPPPEKYRPENSFRLELPRVIVLAEAPSRRRGAPVRARERRPRCTPAYT